MKYVSLIIKALSLAHVHALILHFFIISLEKLSRYGYSYGADTTFQCA